MKEIKTIPFHFLPGLALLFFFSVTSCKVDNHIDPRGKPVVVATTGMIADAVQNIGGPHVEVVTLMGPGVDPHLYKATHGDVEKITTANIIFYNGLHLEGKMGEVLKKAGKIRPVVAVSENIPEKMLRSIPGFRDTHDPHIWFDVSLWTYVVKDIAKNLQRIDTAHADIYQRNSERYLAQLDSLHEAVIRQIQTIPQQQRVMITAHDAFGYFGDAYNIEVKGLQGISTVSEFGLRDVSELVTYIVDRKVKAIFVETSVSNKSINAVVEGCKNRNWNVTVGGALYSDAMGEKGTPPGTYIGMVNANVQTIVSSLR